MKNQNKIAVGLMLLCYLTIFSANAQLPIRCITAEVEAERRAENPNAKTIEDFENWLAPLIKKYKNEQLHKNTEFNGVHKIPVVFHVIHDGEFEGFGSNVSTSKLNSQLSQLNNDFRANEMGSGDCNASLGVDSEITFCPALTDENGNYSSHAYINRIYRAHRAWPDPPYARPFIDGTIKPDTQWDPDRYLNIWVLDLINASGNASLGYTYFPEMSDLDGITNPGSEEEDGVVVRYTTIGSCSNPNSIFDVYGKGRTLTHEVGHWLGLHHIWGDDSSCGNANASDDCACDNDDFVTDTPNQGKATSGCPTGQATCMSSDQVSNYMDYTNDHCMRQFTQGQKDRMKTVLMNSPRRKSFTDWPCQTCIEDLTFTVPDVSNPVYEQASNSITSTAFEDASFFTQTRHVYYKAGNFIELNPGFEAEEGGYFEAGIGDCGEHYVDAVVLPLLDVETEYSIAQTDKREINMETQNPQSKNQAISIYPNPTNNQLTIVFDHEAVFQNAHLQIFDFTGRTVFTKMFRGWHQQETINVNQLVSGTYILRIISKERRVFQQRFVKI